MSKVVYRTEQNIIYFINLYNVHRLKYNIYIYTLHVIQERKTKGF